MKALGTVTLGRYLTVAGLRFGGREAVVDPERGISRTYRELNARANALANALLERGICKGDFVAFLAYNCAEFVEVYFALAKIGAVIAPQVYRLSAREIKELVNHCEAKAFIFAREFSQLIEQIRSDLPSVELYAAFGEDVPEYAIPYEGAIASGSSAEPPVEVTEEDAHYLNYTSGTTGLPKAYILSHYNNAVAMPLLFEEFHLSADDTVLTVFPMYGRVGFAWTEMCVFKGARHVVINFTPERFLQTVEKEKVTMVNLVPTMAQMLLLHPDLGRYDLSSLRGVVFAGAPLPQTVYEGTCERLCSNVYEYYGLQETAIVTSLGPEMKRQRPGSVGLVSAGVDLRLIDDQGREVSTGQIGEVVMRGPGTTAGYYRQPDKTAEVIRNGWFHTGDLGRLDEDGYLYIVGRKKDMIISGGQNIFAPEVEETILAHPAVADCAVIGLPHELWGEAVTAVVKLKEDGSATSDEIIAFCKERIAHFKAPKDVKFASSIPRNPAGKIMKFLLVDQYVSTFKPQGGR